MVLHLKAKHFRGTTFAFDGKCAIEKALTELLPKQSAYSIYEGVSATIIWRGYFDEGGTHRSFPHTRYGIQSFNKDKEKARALKWSKTETVRRISIPKLRLKDFA